QPLRLLLQAGLFVLALHALAHRALLGLPRAGCRVHERAALAAERAIAGAAIVLPRHGTRRGEGDYEEKKNLQEPSYARTFAHICFAEAFTTSIASGSPLMSASRYAFACFTVMCGGSGGTFGSVTISRTVGRSPASAASQAAPTSSALSTRMPFRPSIAA